MKGEDGKDGADGYHSGTGTPDGDDEPGFYVTNEGDLYYVTEDGDVIHITSGIKESDLSSIAFFKNSDGKILTINDVPYYLVNTANPPSPIYVETLTGNYNAKVIPNGKPVYSMYINGVTDLSKNSTNKGITTVVCDITMASGALQGKRLEMTDQLFCDNNEKPTEKFAVFAKARFDNKNYTSGKNRLNLTFLNLEGFDISDFRWGFVLHVYESDRGGSSYEYESGTKGSGKSLVEMLADGSIDEHNDLTGRDNDDCHPISAITGLEDALEDITDDISDINTSISTINNVINSGGTDTPPSGSWSYAKLISFMWGSQQLNSLVSIAPTKFSLYLNTANTNYAMSFATGTYPTGLCYNIHVTATGASNITFPSTIGSRTVVLMNPTTLTLATNDVAEINVWMVTDSKCIIKYMKKYS
jgi:hypothetical protein